MAENLPVLIRDFLDSNDRIEYRLGQKNFVGNLTHRDDISTEERQANLTFPRTDQTTSREMITVVYTLFKQMLEHGQDVSTRKHLLHSMRKLIESWFKLPPEVEEPTVYAQVFLAFYQQVSWFERKAALDKLNETMKQALLDFLLAVTNPSLSQQELDEKLINTHTILHFGPSTPLAQ